MKVLLLLVLLLVVAVNSSTTSYTISNDYYNVVVSVNDTSKLISVSSLSINRNITGQDGWTQNLLYNSNSEFNSGTGGLISGTWVKPVSLTPPVVTANSLHFSNISLQYATESWDLSIEDDLFLWNISRSYLEDVYVAAEQFPVLFFNTTVGIPGFVDSDIFFNTCSSAGFQLDSIYFEFLTPNLNQQLRLAPYNVRFLSNITTSNGFFTFGKAAYDGTSPYVSLGVETVDRRKPTQGFSEGDVVSTNWALQIIPDLGVPYGSNYGPEDLILSIPQNTAVEQLAKNLVPVHNNFMGFAFGNNPASVICLHEMSFFPLMQGILTLNPDANLAIQTEIDFLLSQGVNASGYVMPRWNSGGFYYVVWGPLHDQIPHAILAVYYHAMNTGNKAWLASILPKVELIANYLISLDVDGDGVPEIPNASGLSDGGQHTSNWYDIIEFGHKDAYIAAYSCMALQALVDMHEWLGNSTMTAYYSKLHTVWVEGFNNVFWDENLGYYVDWVDVNGGAHSYFYVDQNLLAIIYGIANKTQAQSILSKLDAQYDNLAKNFNVSKSSIWATPANMLPISIKGDMMFNGSLQNQIQYPNYENGGSFFHSVGFEIAARAVAGDPDGAFDVFANSLQTGHGVGPGFMWSALLKWDSQEMDGEPLTSAMMGIWGLVRGCFGVWPSLTNGLEYSGSHAAILEGASTSFQFLGQIVTISAKNGTMQIS